MFGIGVTEMIVIGLVILMLFSPRELPGMMKTLARAYGSIRRTAEDFRAQVMDAEELREPLEEIRAAYHGTKNELLSAQDLARRELGRARAEAMKAQQKLSGLAREESRREASLKSRVSTSEHPDPHAVTAGQSVPAGHVGTTGPSAPAGTVAVGSSAPAGTVAVGPSAPAGTVASSAPVGTVASSAPVGTVASSAPVAGVPHTVGSAPTVATANTVPSPPVTPTPAPPPPVTSTPASTISSPTFAPPPASDRSDAA